MIEGRAELVIMDLATKRTEQITDQASIKDPGPKNYLHASWFPDGRRILFVYYLLDQWQQGIAVINRQSGRVEKIACVDYLEPFCAQISPTGQEMVFLGKDPIIGDEIYRARLDGSEVIRLTDSWMSCDPDYSQDGKKITYTHKEAWETPFEIWTMNIDGSDKQRVIADDYWELDMSNW